MKLATVREAQTAVRHELRNKLASVRNAAFFIRRKTEAGTDLLQRDARVASFFQLIETELDTCSTLLGGSATGGGAQAQTPLQLAEVLRRLQGSLALPEGISLEVQVEPVSVVAEGSELELALFTLLENAVDALETSGGTVRICLGPRDEGAVRLDVLSPAPLAAPPQQVLTPFFTTRSGRLGLGLKVARRLASGWGGRLEVAEESGGARASLWLQTPPEGR